MKKYIIFLFATLLLLCGCQKSTTLGAPKDYPVQGDVQSLAVDIGGADFVIEQADGFAVESNLKNLTVSEKNGVLTIRQGKQMGVTYTDAKLTLHVPAGTVFRSVEITTGAGRLVADVLSAERVDLSLGAGEVRIGRLEASREADIEGGAGAVTISDGSLRELDLEMGVGELNLTAALLGDCDLSFGVGESNLTLLGSRDDYRVEMDKGIGGINVEGETYAGDRTIGTGPNRVDVEGGVGAINLKFQ